MKNDKLPIIFVTIYFFVYAAGPWLNFPEPLIYLMFALSPFFLAWMVYSILKYGKPSGKILKEGEEWGYADVDRDQL